MSNIKTPIRSSINIDEPTNTIIKNNKEIIFETLRNELNYVFNQQVDKCIQNKVNEFILKHEKQILESVHQEIDQLQYSILETIKDKINNIGNITDINPKKSFIQKIFS